MWPKSRMGKARAGLGVKVDTVAILLKKTPWAIRDIELGRVRVSPEHRNLLAKLLGRDDLFNESGFAIREVTR